MYPESSAVEACDMPDEIGLVKHIITRRFGWALDSGEEFDDLLSVGWEAIVQGKRQYGRSKTKLSFTTFLGLRIYHNILDHIRKSRGWKRKIRVEFCDLPEEVPVAASEEKSLAKVDVALILERLSPREREVLIRCDLNEERQTSVAEDWGVVFQTVSTTRQRALKNALKRGHRVG